LYSFVVEEKTKRNIFEDEFAHHRLVGRGAFFEVYRVRERKTGKLFAIKKSQKAFRGKKDREQYLQEVRMISILGPHPHIIQYYRAWQKELHFFVQMECCASNLSDFIRQMSKPINDVFLWNCAYQISEALLHIHKSSLLHLDIKPENVLVSMDGVLKLADFGQARLKDSWRDGAEGDAQFMAPELLQNATDNPPTAAADVFSLGLMLLQLATNKELPKEGPVWRELREGNAANYLEKARLSGDLQSLILAMLQPQPQQRPSASQILARIPDNVLFLRYRHDEPEMLPAIRRVSL